MAPKKPILIVEDDKELCQLLEDLLRGEGFSVVSATSLAEAQERLSKQLYSIIFVDLQLASQSGLKVIKQIRYSGPKVANNMSTPIILMSGYLEPGVVIEVAPIVQCILAKPFRNDEVVRQVHYILSPDFQNQKMATVQNKGAPVREGSAAAASLHDFSGKLMVVQMLFEQLKELLQGRSDLPEELALVDRIEINLGKLDEIIRSGDRKGGK